MVEGGRGATFPVMFYDGEREINIGNIRVHPVLEFKAFQLMISQKIGISPNQISIYLVPRKSLPEDRQKIPITSKVNFGLVTRQKDCFFLVVLKRSRKSRNRRLKPIGLDFGDYYLDNDFSPPPPAENVVLLRRNQPAMDLNGLQFSDYQPGPFYDPIAQAELAGLNDRLQNLKIQRENYAMAMAKQPSFINPKMVPILDPALDPGSFPRIEETVTKIAKGSNKFFCENCLSSAKKDETAPFHHCVNDQVVASFRSRAGPIERPPKASR